MGDIYENVGYYAEMFQGTPYRVITASKGGDGAYHRGISLGAFDTSPGAGAVNYKLYQLGTAAGSSIAQNTAAPLRAAIAALPVEEDGPFPGASPAGFVATLPDSTLMDLAERIMDLAERVLWVAA